MKKELVMTLRKTFEEHAYEEKGVEFWFARDLQVLLGYSEWRNFSNAIDKAKISVRDSRNGTFTVRLNPRELGSVNVNLIMENGVYSPILHP